MVASLDRVSAAVEMVIELIGRSLLQSKELAIMCRISCLCRAQAPAGISYDPLSSVLHLCHNSTEPSPRGVSLENKRQALIRIAKYWCNCQLHFEGMKRVLTLTSPQKGCVRISPNFSPYFLLPGVTPGKAV